MNFSAILGFFGALGFVGLSIFLTIAENDGMELDAFVNPPGLALVFGGSIMATFLKSSGDEVKRVIPLMFLAFTKKVDKPTNIIDKLVDLATVARKDGLIALQNQDVPDKFMANGVQMLIDGTQAQVVKQTLSGELLAMKLRHKHSGAILTYMGEVLPAMGMIGTLVGLVGLTCQHG